MKKFLLLGAAVLGLSSMATAQNVVDGHTYAADAETGITCKSKWIMDRIHTPETFLNLDFVKEKGPNARSAAIDNNRGKIYVGFSRTITTGEGDAATSNDYAHLAIFDLETGEYEGLLPLTCNGEAISGLLCASQVGIDDAGNVWICGMYSDVSSKPAQIYVVDSFETGECRNVGQWALPAEESDAGGRCDYWDVVGDITGETSNAVCMAAVGSTTAGEKLCLYRWELAQGETEWVANQDDFAGYVSYYDGLDTYPADQATWGSSSATVRIVAEEGHVGSMFYVDGFTTCPSLYNIDLQMVESFASAPDLAPALGPNGIEEFTLNGEKYIAYVENDYRVSPGCRVNICQLGEGMTFEGMRKLWSVPEAGLGEMSDGGIRIHNIDTYKVVDKNGKEGVYLLTYKCYNGIGLYLIAEDGFEEDGFEENEHSKLIEIDGIRYLINEGTSDAKVYTTTNVTSSILEIPSHVDFNGLTYSVTNICNNAFDNCSNLTTIVIPNTISTIGEKAFNNCSGLKTIISLGTTPPACATNTFDNYNTTLYVPKNSFAQYFIDDMWGNFNIQKIEALASSITLNETNLNLNVGDSKKLISTILPTNATIKNIVWRSNDNSIATVDQNGLVTGISEGTVLIYACSIDGSNISTTCTVNVEAIKAEAIVLSQSEINLKVNDKTTLRYTISPTNVSNKSVSWLTSDKNIASISENNDGSISVLGVSAGSATIFAVTKDGSNLVASCKVFVSSGLAESITLSQSEAILPINDLITLSYYISPSDTKDQTATWSTSDKNIAAFRENSDGSINVVGVSEGIAIITATTNDGSNLSASCVITVTDTSGANLINSDNIEIARYDIYGQLLSEPTTGINIVKYSDGTTRKEIIK